jgi:hypothetical protein
VQGGVRPQLEVATLLSIGQTFTGGIEAVFPVWLTANLDEERFYSSCLPAAISVVRWYAGRTTLTRNGQTGEDYGIHKIANYRRHR